jgi:vitamin B12 transporter
MKSSLENFGRPAVWMAGALFVSAAAHAQTQLKQVVVSASRTEQQQRDALPNTTVITRADIEASQALSLPDLLRHQTGLEVAQNGGPGTLASVFMRGAESRSTLVMIDGVPVNNLNFNTAAIEHIALVNVERIEIVRGNVAAMYGSSALGGVIQIFTREGASAPYGHVTAQAGARNSNVLQAGLGMKTAQGTRLSINAESLADGGFNAIDQVKRAGTNPDVDGYRRQTFSVGLSQELTHGKLGLTLRESSGVTAYDSQFGPATQVDESKFTLSGMAMTGEFRLSPELSLNTGWAQQADHLRADVTAFPYRVASKSDTVHVGFAWKPSAGQQWSAVVEQINQAIESNTVYARASRSVGTARLGYLGRWDRHQVQLNLRQDNYSDFGSASTWLAAYGLHLTDAWRVSAQASTGFNAPTFNDLFFPFSGNAALKPEQLEAQELALQYAADNVEARLVAFRNQYTDMIGLNALFQSVNVGRASVDGAELSVRTKIGATSINAGLTSQNPLNQITNAGLNRRAKSLANLGVSHEAGAITFGGQVRHVGERPDGVQRLAAYTVLDLNLTYRVAPEWRVQFKLENATDERYETVYGYRQPGQGAFIGLTWEPKR